MVMLAVNVPPGAWMSVPLTVATGVPSKLIVMSVPAIHDDPVT
jgi:hypothetical protein